MNEIWYLEDPDYSDYDPYDIPTYGTKHLTDRYKRGEHVMNSHEATVMRRIQSETGKSEEEVREIKKYRIELSEAQTAQGDPIRGDLRRAKLILKQITRRLKLAIGHPDVIKEAMELSNEVIKPYMKELIRSKT